VPHNGQNPLPGPGSRRLTGHGGSANSAGVDLSTYRDMDPHLLVGLVNTELRNHCDSLEDLVKTHGLDEVELVGKLQAASYTYKPELNQFR
jgi:Domain of unknown function (DUF4250)